MMNKGDSSDATRAQVGTNGGLSQRWRELANISSEQDDDYEYFEGCRYARNCDADELDAAKLRIKEAMKALLENSNAPANNTYYSRFRDGQRVTCEAVLKIIREIL